jgi:hypothetical protein
MSVVAFIGSFPLFVVAYWECFSKAESTLPQYLLFAGSPDSGFMLLYVVAVRHRMESESGPQSETRATGLKHSTRSPAPNPLSVFSALTSSKDHASRP